MHNTLEGNICKTTVFVQNVYFPFIWFCRGRRCSKCDCIFAEWSKCHDKLCHFACWWWISSVLSLMLQLVLHVQSVLFICHDVQRLNDEWFPPPWKLMLALCSYNGWCAAWAFWPSFAQTALLQCSCSNDVFTAFITFMAWTTHLQDKPSYSWNAESKEIFLLAPQCIQMHGDFPEDARPLISLCFQARQIWLNIKDDTRSTMLLIRRTWRTVPPNPYTWFLPSMQQWWP